MAERATDQKVEAFSAPISLLELAKKRAARLGMTKSGFFRFCLAKELGYSEVDARALSQFMPVARTLGALETCDKDSSSSERPLEVDLAKRAVADVENPRPVVRLRKRKAV